MGVMIGYGVGYLLIGVSAYNIGKILKRSVVINKRDFEKIEQRIRKDERKKVLQDVNNRKTR